METLYYNMKPGLRLHIRRREASTSEESIHRVQEIEELQAQLPWEASAAFITGECCLRCGQRGHNRFKCPNRRKKFCSWCRKEDVFTRYCQCSKPENEQRTGLTSPAARSVKAKAQTQDFSSASKKGVLVYCSNWHQIRPLIRGPENFPVRSLLPTGKSKQSSWNSQTWTQESYWGWTLWASWGSRCL